MADPINKADASKPVAPVSKVESGESAHSATPTDKVKGDTPTKTPPTHRTEPTQKQQPPPAPEQHYTPPSVVERFVEVVRIPRSVMEFLVGGRVIQDHRADSTEDGHRTHQNTRQSDESHGHQGKVNRGSSGVGESDGKTLKKLEGDAAIRMAKFGDKEKAVSPFEKSLVGRFEGGEKHAHESEDGKFSFLKKTAAEWTGFFDKFLSRGMQKIVNWSDVQGILFRGLLQEKGMNQKGVMISDIMTTAGTDKFARVPITLGKAQQIMLATPGAVLTKDMVQEATLGNQLKYLALGAMQAEEGAGTFVRSASRGLFMSQQMENRVAEHLGLVGALRGGMGPHGIESRHAQTERSERERRRRSAWSRLMGEEGPDGEGSVFIPWWSWNREDRTGFRRWFVVVFGSVIIVALFFLIIALMRAFRS